MANDESTKAVEGDFSRHEVPVRVMIVPKR